MHHLAAAQLPKHKMTNGLKREARGVFGEGEGRRVAAAFVFWPTSILGRHNK